MAQLPNIYEPANAAEASGPIRGEGASSRKLEIVGGGSKRNVGKPHRDARLLSTGGLTRIISYDPAELVLTVEAGVRLAEIEALLAERGQMLAFEPWDFADVTGGLAGRSTIGGVVASGLVGSRRVSAGGARDHVLGFAAVNGRGEAFKAGGKVVKNVTGYDLSKLMAGSWGEVALLTEITLKVLPRPAQTVTLAVRGLDAARAVEAMGLAMRAPADVAAASWAVGVTALRLEGFGPSVEARAKMLSALMAEVGAVERLDGAEEHWRRVRCGGLLPREGLPMLWRIVVPPAKGADVVMGIEAVGGLALMDWAGGLVWARTARRGVREVAEAAGGHAMLVDAPEDVREVVPARHPEAAGVAALSNRVRAAFDPSQVFSAGRFA